MRLFSVFALIFLQASISAHAQRAIIRPDDHPPPDLAHPNNQIENDGGRDIGNPDSGMITNDPQPAVAEDNKADIIEIGKKLKECVDKILEAVKSYEKSDSNTPMTTAVTSKIPAKARPCTVVLSAYNTCSTANSDFDALAKPRQAACLCSVQKGIDFNDEMESCYKFVQSKTQYQTYATAIANATALCANNAPLSLLGLGNFGAASNTITAAPSSAPATTAPTTQRLQTSTSAAARLRVISVVAMLSGIAILMALL